MSAANLLARQRAEHRLDSLRRTRPNARALARYASLSVRVDAALLRRLRLDLLRAADAGAEADLWFAGLSESQGVGGFVFDAAAQSLLRRELASETLPDGRRALDTVWKITSNVHARWPQSLRIEEEVTYIALRGKPAAAGDIAALLRPALKAMVADEKRGVEVARWAVRAMSRLPDLARRTDAALSLAIGAAARLGATPRILGSDTPRGLPADLSWLLPPSALATRQSLVCEPFADAIAFREPRPGERGAVLIQVPRTRPVLLELECEAGAKRTVRLLAVELGVPVPLPEGRDPRERGDPKSLVVPRKSGTFGVAERRISRSPLPRPQSPAAI